jgi:1-deoxy-D-xylulose-5-phosphate reductoisomerase
MKKLSILGSTGSIGTQTLAVIAAFPQNFQVISLAAGKNISLLKKQIQQFRPQFVSVATAKEKELLAKELKKDHLSLDIFYGSNGLLKTALAPQNDLLIVAISGTASLLPTYKAIAAGITICLASKEVLVSAGSLIMPLAKSKNISILPIDSEHAALKQCLSSVGEDLTKVKQVTLTASGGPFRTLPTEEFSNITVEKALKHPTWSMGAKISIDSATMMNKGLEIIEAHHLFGLDYHKINVLFHPQSIVHAMAEFIDGNNLAQMGPPDMRLPIQYALFYPQKPLAPWPRLNLAKMPSLEFFEPDFIKFPFLNLAYETGKKNGTAPAVMNAANEIAVSLFLTKKIGFLDIFKIVSNAVEKHDFISTPSLEQIIDLDQATKKEIAQKYV